MRIVLSGGGTGGHIYPALSTGEALATRADAMLFLGSDTGPERALVEEAGLPFVGLPAAPLRRSPAGVFKAASRTSLGFVRAIDVLRRFRPDVVIVTGGYAALAAGLAAAVLHVPLILEEPNAVPGKATRLMAPLASVIAVALEGPERRLPQRKTVATGFPIRRSIASGSAEAAFERWDLCPNRPVLLVIGGSQGALTLNRTTLAGLPSWTGNGIQVLHSAGRSLYDGIRSEGERWRERGYRVAPYIDRMADAYAAADLVVCRGGASTLCEVLACGLPSIVVPYPHHADRHQEHNGRVLEAGGAARMILNRDAVAQVPSLALDLLRDADRLSEMGAASRRMGRPNAADDIAREAVRIAVG